MSGIVKNQAGQGVPVFAQDISSEEGVLGYGSSIAVYISKDGAAAVESNATSVGTGGLTEIGGGYYWCPLTQDETNADILAIFCDHSGTGDIAFDRLVIGTSYTVTNIWTHTPRTLTQTGDQIAAILDGDELTIHRGDSLSVSFTDLGDLSDRHRIWFTVKRQGIAVADSASLIQVVESTGTGTDGLLYINGAAPDDAGNGSITIDDESDGDITITVEAVEMAKVPPGSTFFYDVQMLDTDGDVTTLISGGCTVVQDITRSTT